MWYPAPAAPWRTLAAETFKCNSMRTSHSLLLAPCPMLAALLHPNTSAESALLHKTTGAPCMPRCSPCRQMYAALLRDTQDSCKPVCAHGGHSTMHRAPCPAAPQLQRLCVWKTCAPCPHCQLPHAFACSPCRTPKQLRSKSAFASQCADVPCMPRGRPCRQTHAAPAELTPRQLHMRVLKPRRAPGKW